jgi:hypothetical protein
MLRIGFGKHDNSWFFRVDCWKAGYRVTGMTASERKELIYQAHKLLDKIEKNTKFIISELKKKQK